eukprot:TRINITY_DN1522_c0_g1_i2.p1 TRINITY_DN1522_c0_g1~~TRINITY_DN1522_c0_g1_i2.p1  ORF type:complete len:313 (-),score=82.67 TRINITY_DN1522_c0_g1_i2:98-1036(-)
MAAEFRALGAWQRPCAAVASLALLRLAPCFLPSAAPRSGVVLVPRYSESPVALPISQDVQLQLSRGQAGVAAGVAAVALLAAATSRRGKRFQGGKGAECRAILLQPAAASSPSAFAGISLEEEEKCSKVACQSLRSCNSLYFRRWSYYPEQHRNKLRNRAYNIFFKNKYKKAVKKVLRRVRDMSATKGGYESVDQVLSDLKQDLDEACQFIDETTVQGVIKRYDAADTKTKMFDAIHTCCVRKKLLPKKDPFTRSFVLLGYKPPKCTHVREPRPWQLPGWKSPWMLKWEFEKWRKATGRNPAAARAAALKKK